MRNGLRWICAAVAVGLLLIPVVALTTSLEDAEAFIGNIGARAMVNNGHTYYDKGRYDNAIAAYDLAIRLRPGFARASYALGKILSKQRRYKEAVRAFNQALRGEPYLEVINYDLLDAEKAQRQTGGAIVPGGSQRALSSSNAARH